MDRFIYQSHGSYGISNIPENSQVRVETARTEHSLKEQKRSWGRVKQGRFDWHVDVCLKGISRGDPFIDVISCVLVVPLSFESLINSKFPRIREILGLMEEIQHQLISSLSMFIGLFPLFTGFYTSQVVVWDFFTINGIISSFGVSLWLYVLS